MQYNKKKLHYLNWKLILKNRNHFIHWSKTWFYRFYLIFALKFVPDIVLDSEIPVSVCFSLSTLAIAIYVITKALINDICSCPCVNRPLVTNQLALKYLRFIMQHTFPVFFKLILYTHLCYHIEFEQRKCEVCECVRVSIALHSGYTITVNYFEHNTLSENPCALWC